VNEHHTPSPESFSAIERLLVERPNLRTFCRVEVEETERFYVVQVPAPVKDHGDLWVSTADSEFTVSFDKWHSHHDFEEVAEVVALVDGIMEERLVVTVKTLDGKWSGSTIHPRAESPHASFESWQGEAYTRSWRGTYDAPPPA